MILKQALSLDADIDCDPVIVAVKSKPIGRKGRAFTVAIDEASLLKLKTWSLDNGTDRLSLFTEWVRFWMPISGKEKEKTSVPEETAPPASSKNKMPSQSEPDESWPSRALPEVCQAMRNVQEGRYVRFRCTVFGCIYWHPSYYWRYCGSERSAPPTPKRAPLPTAARTSAGEDRQPKPGFFKSLNLSTEQEKLVTDLNLTESKSANTDKDVEMSDPEKSPKRDVLEDVDMSNIDNEEEEMEANPNLNQSRISDYFPPTK